MPRSAPFEVPYHLSGVYCSSALLKLHVDSMVDKFPPDLIERLNAGSGFISNGYTITQDDIESLSEEAWTYLQSQLA